MAHCANPFTPRRHPRRLDAAAAARRGCGARLRRWGPKSCSVHPAASAQRARGPLLGAAAAAAATAARTSPVPAKAWPASRSSLAALLCSPACGAPRLRCHSRAHCHARRRARGPPRRDSRRRRRHHRRSPRCRHRAQQRRRHPSYDHRRRRLLWLGHRAAPVGCGRGAGWADWEGRRQAGRQAGARVLRTPNRTPDRTPDAGRALPTALAPRLSTPLPAAWCYQPRP